jgi:hypothetical protein
MRLAAATVATLLLAFPAWAQTDADEPQGDQQNAENVDSQSEDLFALDPAVALEAFTAGNYPRAFDLAITFATRGDLQSMRLLGEMYSAGLGVDQDQDEAAEWLALASQQGDLDAKVLLATMILDRVIDRGTAEEAADLLKQAADGDNVGGKQLLAMLHLEGRGVERDLALGAQLMREAAQANDVTAQYTMGILYAEGAGVRQDTREAYSWFNRAARRGNTEAQIELAMGLLNGDAGNAQDSEERRIEDAVFWFRRAAEAGNPVAENRLAHAHAQGLGVPLDPVLAAYYHARAVAGGLADARLDAFVLGLPEEQRRQARARVAFDRANQR